MNSASLNITELARQTGISSSAIRYYEQEGLIQPVARTDAGYRLYESETIGRLRFILRAKALGLSLREIRQLVQQPADSTADMARLRHAIAHKLADTKRRITELEVLREDLEALQQHFSDGVTFCGRIGDCECWLPMEEVGMMSDSRASMECSCCGCTCPSVGECTCCGCPSPDCELHQVRGEAGTGMPQPVELRLAR